MGERTGRWEGVGIWNDQHGKDYARKRPPPRTYLALLRGKEGLQDGPCHRQRGWGQSSWAPEYAHTHAHRESGMKHVV